MTRMYTALKIAVFLLLSLVSLVEPALASNNGGGLPWDTPLQTLQADLSGPVATSISVLALFAAGGALAFGEELGHFVRRALLLVLAISFLVLGQNILIALGILGALV